jgi:hypothetical protein
MGIQAGLNVPQAFPSRQLGVSQTKELIEGGEGFNPMLPSMLAITDIEIVPGEKLKQLPEDGFAGIHGYPSKYRRVPSTRIQIENGIYCKRAFEINNL